MPIYRTSGKLTGVIEPENVADAQKYLDEPGPVAMAGFLDESLRAVEFLEWRLDGNGRDYTITAVATRELTDAELKDLSSEVQGQNSDGLGEGFEQQDFAWREDDDCGVCDGCENDFACESEGNMISFDWETNDSRFERIV